MTTLRLRPGWAISLGVGACLLPFLMAGCGCSKKIENGISSTFAKAAPLNGSESALLLMYLDDSASMDNYRKQYGEWAIQVLRSIGAEDPTKVGVRMSTFRSNVIDTADLKLTGKSQLEGAIVGYQDAHAQADPDESKKSDSRERGTSLKAVLQDAIEKTKGTRASAILVVILCDGGVEDGAHGDWKGAIASAKAFASQLAGKDVRVLMLGLSEAGNGASIRSQKSFWSQIKIPYQLGKKADTDAIISTELSAFGAKAK